MRDGEIWLTASLDLQNQNDNLYTEFLFDTQIECFCKRAWRLSKLRTISSVPTLESHSRENSSALHEMKRKLSFIEVAKNSLLHVDDQPPQAQPRKSSHSFLLIYELMLRERETN